ncbi:MAG: SDR family NAD(P)-dependent oxidoreductase [Candidatus Eremiobacterota bacterium]
MQRPVVLVTGASRGLGAATCEWLGQAGAAVALLARDAAQLDQVAARVVDRGGDALCRPVDLADPRAARKAADEVVERFGRLDALVNNAAVVTPVGPLADVDADQWLAALQINVAAPMLLIQACLPALRGRQGRIVNVSTGAANRAIPSWTAYCTTKAALLMLTNTLAAEEPAVTCVSLRPGVVDTGMQEEIRERADRMPPQLRDYFRGLKANGELEPPHVPARVCAWLALAAPRQLTGQLVDYSDEQIASAARAFLGEPAPR